MTLTTLDSPEKTQVGSYFVATYPPFSAWSPAHVGAALEQLDAPGSDARPLGLYLHIPFCRKRCKFCYFRVYTDKNAADVEDYLKALGDEVGMYAQRGGLRGRQFEFVYFGGGTPSFLSSEQLLRLIDRIRRHWTWDAAREVTFECEPGTLKQSKVQAIRSIGVTRLSLGVEHFDDEILAANGRAHRGPEVLRAFGWAREAGFAQINIDLIAGMLGEDGAKWKRAVDRAIELDPDSVTIYQMELPFNTIISREARLLGGLAPVADWPAKRQMAQWAFERFEEAGYVVSSAYTLVRPERHAGFVYRDALWHGADMVGTGVASFSHFGGVHFQNADTWEDYLRSLGGGQLPIHRALPTTPRQRLIRELILQLKLGRVQTGYFRRKFSADILAEFAGAWESLVAEGLARVEPDAVALSREGLLRVDALLPRFYEEQYRNVRYT
jgi:oxygen-independent coproporphyrinogen-3 oxidase